MRNNDFTVNRSHTNGPGGVRCRCCRHVAGGVRANRRYTNRRARRASREYAHTLTRSYNG